MCAVWQGKQRGEWLMSCFIETALVDVHMNVLCELLVKNTSAHFCNA